MAQHDNTSNTSIHIDPSDAVPIWRQIEEGMEMLVATGVLRPGATVPSVRELARELRINPATVSKAYRKLVASSTFEVQRGLGTRVAEQPPTDHGRQRARLREAAVRYTSTAVNLRVEKERAIEEVDRAWSEIRTGRRSDT